MEIIKLKSQLSVVVEQVVVHLGQAQDALWSLFRRRQNNLTTLEKSFTDTYRRLLEALRARKNAFRELLATSLYSITVGTGKIVKFRAQLFVALGQVTAGLKKAQNKVTRLGRSFAGKPKKTQKTLRSRENDLRKLLASSPDAIVATSLDRRFVAANLKARDLFGVSETNMSKFTVDAFLSCNQIPEFGGNDSLRRRKARQGKCELRRLDGSLLVAEYSFIANFVSSRHLYRFYNIAAINQNQPATLRKLGKLSIVRARDKAS